MSTALQPLGFLCTWICVLFSVCPGIPPLPDVIGHCNAFVSIGYFGWFLVSAMYIILVSMAILLDNEDGKSPVTWTLE